MTIWERFDNMDRRWVYLMVALAVIIPFIFPMKFDISITPEVQSFYDAVDNLPDSCTVMLVFDYYPSTAAEWSSSRSRPRGLHVPHRVE